MCCAMACLAISGSRIRIADTTAVWLYRTLASHGLLSLLTLAINSSIDA